MTALLAVIVASIAISFLCSVLEAVLLSVTHSHVALMQERSERAGNILAGFRTHIDEPIAAILTLNTIAHTVGATVAGAFALEVLGSRWIAAFSVALTLAILIASEIIPKTIGATYWQSLAGPTGYVLRWMVILMKPVLIPLGWLTRLITPRDQNPVTVSRAEFEVLAEISRREGELDVDEWRVVSNVLHLDQIHVGRVMTPRPDVVAVPRDASVERVRDQMLLSGHLRLPVYDGTIDNIVGIVVGRDLWRAETEAQESLEGILRPPLFVSYSHDVDTLIRRMRTKQIKMAVVLDEYGGTAGIVTLEDLIEEIVGEIQDEHETEPAAFEDLPGGDVRIQGDTPVRSVNERLDLDLDERNYDTIGGFMFGRLGHLPREGETLRVDGGEFVIDELHRRRIVRLRFRKDEE